MTSIASCGHELKDGDEGEYVILSGEDCDAMDGFRPCTFHHHWCADCAAKAKTWPEYLPSPEAADEWLTSASREHRAKKVNR